MVLSFLLWGNLALTLPFIKQNNILQCLAISLIVKYIAHEIQLLGYCLDNRHSEQ